MMLLNSTFCSRSISIQLNEISARAQKRRQQQQHLRNFKDIYQNPLKLRTNDSTEKLLFYKRNGDYFMKEEEQCKANMYIKK